MKRLLAGFFVLLSVQSVPAGAASERGSSTVRIGCHSDPTPLPVRPCGACKLAFDKATGVKLRVPRGSDITWESSHAGWTVNFDNSSPCQRHRFDSKHPTCRVTAPSGSYQYRAVSRGCRDETGEILID